MNYHTTEYEPEEDWDFDYTTDYEPWEWYQPQPHGEHLLIYCWNEYLNNYNNQVSILQQEEAD